MMTTVELIDILPGLKLGLTQCLITAAVSQGPTVSSTVIELLCPLAHTKESIPIISVITEY